MLSKYLRWYNFEALSVQKLLAHFCIPSAPLYFEGRDQVDGSLFRVLQVQLNFGNLLHISALSPQLQYQICDTLEKCTKYHKAKLASDVWWSDNLFKEKQKVKNFNSHYVLSSRSNRNLCWKALINKDVLRQCF